MMFFYRAYIILFSIVGTLNVSGYEEYDSSKNYLSIAVDEYVDNISAHEDGELETLKEILINIKNASKDYYKGLSRLFFFKLSYDRNSKKINEYHQKYLEKFNALESKESIICFHHKLQQHYEKWNLLHHNYSYYSGYFW